MSNKELKIADKNVYTLNSQNPIFRQKKYEAHPSQIYQQLNQI